MLEREIENMPVPPTGVHFILSAVHGTGHPKECCSCIALDLKPEDEGTAGKEGAKKKGNRDF